MLLRPSVLLGAFWFLYMGALGIFFPFFSLYLTETAGLSGRQAGVILAVVPVVGVLVQPLWGQLADRTGRRGWLLVVLALATAGAHVVLAVLEGFGPLILGSILLALFASAIVPTGVAVSLEVLGGTRAASFGRVRAFGTIGFLVSVAGFPLLVKALGRFGVVTGLEILFFATAALVVGSALVVALIPPQAELRLKAARGEWRALLRDGPFVRFLVFTLGAYLFLHGPMVFFPVYVSARGGDLETVSRMWILMLLPEIPLVAWAGSILRRLGPRGLVGWGVLAGGLRWTLCAWVDDLRLVYLLQLLHGPVVAGILIGGALYVDAIVPERLRSTGQALLAMVGIGMGGALSSLASGWLIDRIGPDLLFAIGGVGALVLGVAGFRFLPGVPSEALARDPARSRDDDSG